MAKKSNPTIRQLIYSVVAGLASHPRVLNPRVFYPIFDEGEEPEEIFIDKWRCHDGLEFQEPGLTCSVFPNHSGPTGNTIPESKSVIYEPYDLTRRQYLVTYNLVLKLSYRAPAFNQNKTIQYYVFKDPNGDDFITPHGHNFYLAPGEEDGKTPRELRELNQRLNRDYIEQIKQLQEVDIEMEVSPGEEIVRDYMELMRGCIQELQTVLPWNIRSTTVTGYDFPTTSWQEQEGQNFLFHTAYLQWNMKCYPPTAEHLKTLNAVPIKSNSFKQELLR